VAASKAVRFTLDALISMANHWAKTMSRELDRCPPKANRPLVFFPARTPSTPVAIAAVRLKTLYCLARDTICAKARSLAGLPRRRTRSTIPSDWKVRPNRLHCSTSEARSHWQRLRRACRQPLSAGSSSDNIQMTVLRVPPLYTYRKM
jgi:hypothetical protein